ncbi:MAG: TonB-dependent receptor [Gammaproteobacteria bacterium]
MNRSAASVRMHPASLLLAVLSVSAAERQTAVEFEKIDIFADERSSERRFGRTTLDRRRLLTVQDFARAVPNLNAIDSGTRSFIDILSVRGLSHTPFANNPALQVYVDDIPYGGPFTYANPLFEAESVTVFRGPQNAAFGANAYGGVIDVKSRQPGNAWRSQLTLGGGNFGARHGSISADGALLADKLYLSLAGAYRERDGYLTNTLLAIHPDDQRQLSARTALRWTPDNRWDVKFITQVDDFDDGAPRLTPVTDDSFTKPLADVSYRTRASIPGKMKQIIDSQALRIGYQANDYEIVSVTSRRQWRLDPWLADTDLRPQDIAVLKFRDDQQRWTQDFRIRSTESDALWGWSIGFFFATSEFNGRREVGFFGAADDRRWNLAEDDYSLLGQLVLHPLESVRITPGLRLDWVEKSMRGAFIAPPTDQPAFSARRDDFFISPKLEVDYALSDQLSLYASTALAYKPGGFRPFRDERGINEFVREKTWANEAGVQWHSVATSAKLAAFYYRIHDYQVERLLSLFDFRVVNAKRADSYGVEVELDHTLWNQLTLEAGFGYNRIEFIDHKDPVNGTDFTGNRAPFAPEFNLLLAADYRHPGGFFARTEGVWTGRTYFDQQNSSLFSQKSYAILNAHLGFSYRHFTVTAYGDNLTGTRYYYFKLPPALAGTPGQPRTYGIQLSLRF